MKLQETFLHFSKVVLNKKPIAITVAIKYGLLSFVFISYT